MRIALALAGALLIAACSDEVEPEPIAASPAAVVGGEMIEACQWPTTIYVNSCTGTLIHPRVVTTAAHCLSGTTGTVRFGGGRNAPGSFTLMGECHAGARGAAGGGTRNDWGYCVIPEDERVKKIPVTPPLVGCEAEKVLKVGATAWVVGYGSTNASGAGAGVKRQVAVKVNRFDDGIVDIGDRDVGACHGDSGGPLYMQAGDATHDWGWRTVGSTSSAGSSFCDCTCNTIYVNIAMHVAAIEREEGIDVTPCTDENGDWDPSPECASFASAPQMGSGTFPDCKLPLTMSPIETCGPNMNGATAGTGGAAAGMGGMGGSGGSGGMGGMGGSGGSGDMGGSGGMSAGGAGGAGGSGATAGNGGMGGAMMGGMGGTAVPAGGVGGMAMAGPGGMAGVGAVPGGAGGIGTTTSGVMAGGTGGSGGFGATGAAGYDAGTGEEAGCSAASPGTKRRSGAAAPWLLSLLGLIRRRRATTDA